MMRGIELGMPVARTARRGFLTFADSHGQIHAEIPSNSTDMALLRALILARQLSTSTK